MFNLDTRSHEITFIDVDHYADAVVSLANAGQRALFVSLHKEKSVIDGKAHFYIGSAAAFVADPAALPNVWLSLTFETILDKDTFDNQIIINTASIVRAPLLYGAATSAYLNPPTTERKRRAALAMMSPWEPDLFPGVNDDKT